MRMPIGWTILFAIVGVAIVWGVGSLLLQPNLPLIVSAGFADEIITPNADGEGDVTRFRYEIARNADVTLTLTHPDGQTFVFRETEPRFASDYEVLFSGVVDGYVLPDENVAGEVERRLLSDGDYTWRLLAENDAETAEATGTLVIANADSPLPEITIFTVGPEVFTPNQDGIDDRVEINVYLEKEAELSVFLLAEDGREIPISARKEGREPGEAGRHIFDYEGGIDLGADPPDDGTYTVVALAQDDEGQRVRREATLTILDGGKPRAEIVPQSVGVDVVFDVMPYDDRFLSEFDALGDLIEIPGDRASLAGNAITMPLGDMLVFRATVENYSDVKIRTTSPPPGTVYQQDQLPASLGAFEESGAWRLGIQCETSRTPFPYRWAIGSSDVLVVETDPESGETFSYLPAGESAVVWGAIRLTDLEIRQNPQNCWAGLIHEDVEVSLRNSFVGAREIELVDPNATSNE
jgi:hypothetical protein